MSWGRSLWEVVSGVIVQAFSGIEESEIQVTAKQSIATEVDKAGIHCSGDLGTFHEVGYIPCADFPTSPC